MDHDVDAVDVESAGRHIGGDERRELPGGEVLERLLTGRLAEVAVNGRRPHAFTPQVGDEAVGAPLRAAEAQRLGRAADDGGAHLGLVELVHLQETVLHLVDRHLPRLHLVQDGVTKVAADDLVDGRVQRGGEQQRLALDGHAPQQPFDLRQEAHVGHPVGLVDDERRDLVEPDRFAVREVDEPTRRRDDDVGAVGELARLAVEVGAAVDREDSPVDGFCKRLEDFGDLDGELAGRDEDERGRGAGAGARRPHEHRQAEGERLARAGLRLAADVATRERVCDRECLNGKGRLMPWLPNASTSSGATPRPAKVVPVSISVVIYFLAVALQGYRRAWLVIVIVRRP